MTSKTTNQKTATERSDGAKLTPKQEAFCRAYLETGNASEAYRRAYNPKKMSAAAVQVEGSRLLSHPMVALWLEKRQAQVAEKLQVTVESLIAELEEARLSAMDSPKGAAAAVSATMGKAKLLGFLVEKQEHTGKDGGPVVTAETVTLDEASMERVRRFIDGY